jgi:transposase
MGKIKTSVVFKAYNQSQALLLPASLEELIPSTHLVRVVNTVVEHMDITAIINSYEGGGTSAYHPRMLLKVLLYGYCMKIYTGRRLAKALREDVNFMWLAAYNRPDFRTINLFRSGLLKDTIEEVFKSMLVFLMEQGYIKFENYFCDGSTFAANANRHKMVWKKNAVRYKEATEQKCKELFRQIEVLNAAEESSYGDRDLEETDPSSKPDLESQISAQVEKLDGIINGSEGKAVKRKARTLKKKLQEHKVSIDKYERQQQISGQRSGYSKTDEDATAMKMKNDEVLPAYNVLIGTEDQFITNYSVHQKTNDGACFKEHMEQLEAHTEQLPQHIIADSIFGTEENSELLEQKGIDNYMKFPLYRKEQTRKYKTNPFNKDNFSYDQQSDTYTCPDNRQLSFKGIRKDKNRNGFISESRLYECEDCHGCPFAERCKKSIDNNRTILVNENLERYKELMRTNLSTQKGDKLKRKRGYEVESCFGDLKSNQGFRRFGLRGKEKVKTEAGILMISHNLRKIHLQSIRNVA